MSTPYLSLVTPDHAAEPTVVKRTLYVLVRRDIPIAQQLVQAAHAAAEAGRTFYKAEHGIASLIVLTVPDVRALHAARARIEGKGVQTLLFHEPDYGIGDSALSTEPLLDEQRKYLASWPLWRLPVDLKEAA